MNNYNGILAAIANLQVKKGKTVTLYAILTDPNNDDLPYDLSVFDSLESACKRNPNDANFLWQKTLSYQGSNNNILVIPLTPIETDLVAGKYYWDCIGLSGTDEIPLVEGKYIVEVSVQ